MEVIEHNRQKFTTLQTKRRCVNGPDHHCKEVHEEIFMHQMPVKIGCESIYMEVHIDSQQVSILGMVLLDARFVQISLVSYKTLYHKNLNFQDKIFVN